MTWLAPHMTAFFNERLTLVTVRESPSETVCATAAPQPTLNSAALAAANAIAWKFFIMDS